MTLEFNVVPRVPTSCLILIDEKAQNTAGACGIRLSARSIVESRLPPSQLRYSMPPRPQELKPKLYTLNSIL